MFIKRTGRFGMCALFVALLTSGFANQSILINYQAKVAIPNGTHNLIFFVFAGGTADVPFSGDLIYFENNSVYVQDGVVSYAVGTGTPVYGELNDSTFRTDAEIFIQVNEPGVPDIPVSRSRIEPVPFAISTADDEVRTALNSTKTPGDSMNTLVISQPGSYYLAGNLTGDSGKNGISVQANDVTIDLNGFALIAGGGGNFRGVDVPNAQSGFCIRNGSVSGWTDGGVRADAAVTLAEDLRLFNNTNATGLAVGNGSLVKNCIASNNHTGFFGPDRSHFSHCIATVNDGDGFSCTSYVTLIDCTSSRNTNNGLVVQGSGSIIRCDTSFNNAWGITAGFGCTITDCTAGTNDSDGISTQDGSTVRHCTAQANGYSGIAVTNNCQVVDNTCDQNDHNHFGAAGVIVNGGGNRIEGNNCTSNPEYGIRVPIVASIKNLIIRNRVQGSTTNYAVIAGNRYGPVIDMRASTGSGVVDNSSTSGTLLTTDAWANYAY